MRRCGSTFTVNSPSSTCKANCSRSTIGCVQPKSKGWGRAEAYTRNEYAVAPASLQRWEEVIERLGKHEPVQYIFRQGLFSWSRAFGRPVGVDPETGNGGASGHGAERPRSLKVACAWMSEQVLVAIALALKRRSEQIGWSKGWMYPPPRLPLLEGTPPELRVRRCFQRGGFAR